MSEIVPHDQRLCLAAGFYLADWLGVARAEVRPLSIPEHDPGTPPDRRVDLLVEIGGRRVSLEHTTLESYEQQIGDGYGLQDLLGLIGSAVGPLPAGTFSLAVEARAARGLVGKSANAAAAELGPHIAKAAEHLAAEARPGTHLIQSERLGRVRLQFRPGPEVEPLQFTRVVPPDLESARVDRMRLALSTKLPKLNATREDGYEPCLVLEDRDMSLANPDVILNSARAAMEGGSFPPPTWAIVAESIPPSPLYWMLYDNGEWVGIDESGFVPIDLPDCVVLAESEG